MNYQLSTGKTINITFEQWSDLDDEKIQEYISNDSGIFLDDPFINVNFKEFKKFNIPEIEMEDLSEEDIKIIENEIKRDTEGGNS